MNYNGQSLNLSEYIAKRKDEFDRSMRPDDLWHESLMWAMEDYYSSMGEFSEEDWRYIRENGLEEEAYYCENPD